MVKKILSRILFPLILLLVTLPIIFPFAHSGYFPSHDGEWAVVRLGDMFREIRDHQFPPRYSGNLNFGYGYPLFNFAYPFPYYAGLVLYLLKFSFIDSIKIIFAASLLLSAFFMYLAAKEFWGSRRAGFVSALLFSYLPYHLVDLYVRGSIGESCAFVFYAALFYFGVKMYKNPKNTLYITLIALCLVGLVLSHNIMAIFFVPIYILFLAALIWKEYKAYVFQILVSFVLGLGGAAFFWLPALAEKHLILLSKIPIADRVINYVTVQDLLFRTWGYGLPEAAQGGFTYQIGWSQLAAFFFVLGLFVLSVFRKIDKSKVLYARVVGALSIAVIVMILLMFSFTNSIWESLPLLKEINYPWTLLGPIGFLISFLAGYLITVKREWIKLFAVVIGISAILLYLPYAHPEKFTYHDNSYYLTNDATTTSSSEYTPLWVKERPLSRSSEKVLVTSGKGTVNLVNNTSKNIVFTANLQTNAVVRINTIYYPGWKITVDGMHAVPNFNNSHGVMDLSLEAGNHTVQARFTETPLRAASDAISLISVTGIVILLAWSLFRKIRHV